MSEPDEHGHGDYDGTACTCEAHGCPETDHTKGRCCKGACGCESCALWYAEAMDTYRD